LAHSTLVWQRYENQSKREVIIVVSEIDQLVLTYLRYC